MSQETISRRTILRGLGTVMALPFLEALAPARGLAAGGGASGALGAAAKAPVRMAFIMIPNGVNLEHWLPRGAGSVFELPATLEPLQAFKDDLLILSGLTHDKGRGNGDGPGDHARAAAVFLTGAQAFKTPGANIRGGISADQVAARAIGGQTRFPSLELACDGGRDSGDCDSGYSCAYSNNISWASPTTPMAKEIDPRRAFDRLFAGHAASEVAESRARRRRQNLSVLDFVLEDARRLRGDLGGNDQRKLDEYFTSVREIEHRLAQAERAGRELSREPDGLPETTGAKLHFEQHLRLLCDMIVLAFQTDVTRISTFMFAREGSNRNYRHAGVAEGHHDLSHHQRDPEKLEKIHKIDRFHVAQLAYFLERLKRTKDGEGSLLDNCMILFGSGISDGNRHNREDLPILLAGKGGGAIDTGRHVRYEYETPMCNLLLSMLDTSLSASGVAAKLERFGDSTGRLRGLTV